MAFSLFSNNGKVQYGVRKYIADSVEDLKKIPKSSPGSEIFCIENSSNYVLNSSQTWEVASTNSNKELINDRAIEENGIYDLSDYGTVEINIPDPLTQSKTATPTENQQIIDPDEGYLLENVIVEAIPNTYINTSDATVTAGDIALNKIAYGANGQIIGTNDYVKPNKGIIFNELDNNGYPTSIEVFGITSIPYLFCNVQSNALLKNIQKVKINEGITSIDASAFRYMSNLVDVFLPTSITYLGNYVFSDSSIEELIIPNINQLSNFGYIGNCPNLKKIEIWGPCCIWTSFLGRAQTLTQLIFKGSIDQWRTPFINNDNPIADSTIELYDFSGCNEPFVLSNVNWIPHAPGCVIKIKQGTLSAWQSATNWCDLSTDPNDTNYVIWQEI